MKNTRNVNKAFAGSIINQLNSSGGNAGHVGLIDQNDFYTVTSLDKGTQPFVVCDG